MRLRNLKRLAATLAVSRNLNTAFRAFFRAIKTRLARIFAFKLRTALFANAMLHLPVYCVFLAVFLLPSRT